MTKQFCFDTTAEPQLEVWFIQTRRGITMFRDPPKIIFGVDELPEGFHFNDAKDQLLFLFADKDA